MKPEYLLTLYSLFKTVILGYSAYEVLEFPLFVTLPVSLIVSMFPIISEAPLIYYGAQAFDHSYWWSSLWLVIVPFVLIVVLPCLYTYRNKIWAYLSGKGT